MSAHLVYADILFCLCLLSLSVGSAWRLHSLLSRLCDPSLHLLEFTCPSAFIFCEFFIKSLLLAMCVRGVGLLPIIPHATPFGLTVPTLQLKIKDAGGHIPRHRASILESNNSHINVTELIPCYLDTQTFSGRET